MWGVGGGWGEWGGRAGGGGGGEILKKHRMLAICLHGGAGDTPNQSRLLRLMVTRHGILTTSGKLSLRFIAPLENFAETVLLHHIASNEDVSLLSPDPSLFLSQ